MDDVVGLLERRLRLRVPVVAGRTLVAAGALVPTRTLGTIGPAGRRPLAPALEGALRAVAVEGAAGTGGGEGVGGPPGVACALYT
ncbi:hypothetical protein P5X51_14310, partial [Microbacterium sp. RD06]|uniref:hypothetical protein n=1 Tax=Microbacterium sp. RD06 TaxID=3035796 RepID=UPI002468B702